MFPLALFSFVSLGVSSAVASPNDFLTGNLKVNLDFDHVPRHYNASTSLIPCLTKAGLNPVTPSSPSYQNDSLPINLRLIYQPAALVYPNTAEDVSKAVKCGVANDVKVTARSGGHSCKSTSSFVVNSNESKFLTMGCDRCIVQHGWRGRTPHNFAR